MSYTIDPSKAIVDLDSISLTQFSITPATKNSTEDRKFIVSLVLKGGLGRIFIEGIGDKFVEDKIEVKAESLFTLNDVDIVNMKDLLSRWHKISPPLRYVDFGEKAVILEDSDRFMIMPKGKRDINFNLPLD